MLKEGWKARLEGLKNYARDNTPACKINFPLTVKVVNHCYAALMIEQETERTIFAKTEKENVFGDYTILKTALILSASILTLDKPLKRMAGYAGIKTFADITKAN